ncbi:hypothetical protein MJC1_01708 [Methylocystis sp. MJC1]|nr:hypothetical protein MJC1_01708 [Methylocystis sp. MJC1]
MRLKSNPRHFQSGPHSKTRLSVKDELHRAQKLSLGQLVSAAQS